jgi:hypothetical protein
MCGMEGIRGLLIPYPYLSHLDGVLRVENMYE